MKDKKSFLFYTDYFEQIEYLTIEQRGILLTAIMSYQTGKDIPEMDPLTHMAYSFISSDMRRDNEKYEEVVQKRKEAGRKGGQKTAQANQANATFAQANQANQANADDNVNVNVNDNVNDNENVNDSVNVCVNDNVPANTQHTPSRPNPNDVLIEANNAGYPMTVADVANFMAYNDANEWKLDWHYALKRWNENENRRSKKPKIKTAPSEQHYYDKDELRRRAKE